MRFELTPELLDQILFAMENQDDDFVVEADTSLVLPLHQLSETEFDDERHYAIPEWHPADGFRTMEAFCSQVHNPVYRERLLEVLGSGRKVFRRFKETLRERPELEERYRRFKQRTMQRAVDAWYDALRELWGLERRAGGSQYSEELIHTELTVVAGEQLADAGSILARAEQGMWESLEREIGAPLALRARKQRDAVCEMPSDPQAIPGSPGSCVFFGTTPAGEAVGSIWLSCAPGDVYAEIGILYVEPEYRGIGLAQELIERGLREIRRCRPACAGVVLPLRGAANALRGYLERIGAEHSGSEYTIDLL